KTNTSVAFTIELLDGGGRSVEHGDDHLSVVGALTLVHDDEIAIANLLVDHRIAPHAQYVMTARPADERFWNTEGLVVLEGLDRHTGGDAAKQWKLDRPRGCLRGKDLDRATLV